MSIALGGEGNGVILQVNNIEQELKWSQCSMRQNM